MSLYRIATIVGCPLVLFAAVACGSSAEPGRTATPSVSSTSTAARATVSRTPQASATLSPDTPAAATPTPTVRPDPAGVTYERAPIDKIDLIVEETNPVQYAVHILSGLPSGCHQFDHATLSRAGSELTVDVENRRPADTSQACTAIYGTHETTVQLGSDFASGATYRIQVNDKVLEFTAQ